MARRAPSVARIEQSGILRNSRHPLATPEEFRRILKCEKTGRDIPSDNYPSVAQYRRDVPQRARAGYMARMLALSDLCDMHGVESAETARGGEWLEHLNAGDSYAVTVVYFRGVFSLCSLGDWVESSRVKFR
jgi:hypothetical protein